MALEWYEWKCPHCKRYGQVNPSKDYEDGEHWAQKCPVCGAEIVVLCSYEPVFYAYHKESWKEGGDGLDAS